MNKKTLKALRKSIEHWEANVAAKTPADVKLGPNHCALCQLFNKPTLDEDKLCKGCPIFDETEEQFCERTPYESVHKNWDSWVCHASSQCSNQDIAYREKLYRKSATRMLNFLKDLLPKEG